MAASKAVLGQLAAGGVVMDAARRCCFRWGSWRAGSNGLMVQKGLPRLLDRLASCSQSWLLLLDAGPQGPWMLGVGPEDRLFLPGRWRTR